MRAQVLLLSLLLCLSSATAFGAFQITSPSTLPNAIVHQYYTFQVTVTGNTGNVFYSCNISGAGISVSNWSGLMTGTPTATGTFTGQCTVQDQTTYQILNQPLTITVVAPPTVTTASLPNGITGAVYAANLSATGGTPPYTWTVLSGSFPSGLSLAANGAVSGTPAAAGTYNFTVRATDTALLSATAALSITIAPGLGISTTSLPSGLASTPYTASLVASGGIPGYTWSLTLGSLPPGLTLAANGTISGTPTTPGAFNFTVRATDSTSPTPQVATQGLTLTVGPALAITTTSLPNGLVSSAYNHALAATGGTPGYTWSLASGNLPSGLTLAGNGAISGTPAAAGTYNFVIRATDSTSPTPQTATQGLAITIGPALTITTPSLPNGLVSTPYSQALAATGGTPGYTWSLASGALPAGLTLAPGGTISGTPTIPGTFNFIVRATDSSSPTPQVAAQTFALTVGPALTITTSSLPDGLASSAYNHALAATGGTPGYTWSLASGNLPSGITLASNGTIAGTPAAAGTYNFVVQATDSTSPAAQTATKALTLTIGPALTITTSSLPNGLVSTPYTQALAATGGTAGYIWSLASGNLPSGLTLAGNGVISGTPVAAGTYNFVVQATASTSPAAQTATKALTLTIGPALTITTSSLPNGLVSTPYTQALAATGGTPGYAWSLASGNLPFGLTLAGNGMISGTPAAAGTYNFVIQAADSTSPSAQTATRGLTLTIGPALAITTTGLPNGLVSSAYNHVLAATGGTPGYTWSLASGSLPAGLALASNGAISGTPSTPGTYAFTVQAVDSTSPTPQTATGPLSIAIVPALSITTSALPDAATAKSYSQTLVATGGTAPYTWSLTSGSLPPGLALAANGAISGTPTAAGTYPFVVQATDSTSPATQTVTASLSITATASFTITTASPLPPALAGSPYSVTITGSGGTPPYAWTLASGAPPAGLTLAPDGTLSGTPVIAGTVLFSVLGTDSTSPTPQTAIKPLAVVVNARLSITTTELPDGIVNTAYARTVAATGGTSPYTWSVSSGTLPAGLTLTSDGIVSGTPAEPGPAAFSLQVTDSTSPTPQTATQPYTVTITAALAISTSILPPAVVGATYNAPLTATGGTAPYRWDLIAGNLPPGLSLSPGGYITGTCIAAGSYSITIQAIDSTSPTPQTATRTLTIDGNPSLSIATQTIPQLLVGQPYSGSLAATGGLPPYIWSLAAGTLPVGITLSEDGSLAGTPTTAGQATISVRVTDSLANTTTKAFNLVVLTPLVITTTVLPAAVVGSNYSAALAATGGASPYTWSIVAGSLPAGLTFSSDGKISGTPAAPGAATFTVQVSDSTSPAPQTASKTYTLTVVAPLVITTTALPSALHSAPYSQSLTASGGLTPYTWSITTGSLPPGLSLAPDGTISGIPTTAGTAIFTVQVTDNTTPHQTATRDLTLLIHPPLTITTTTLPPPELSRSYTAALAATGGTYPYTWSIAVGSLPAGLTLSSDGTISGIPSATGSSTFTVQVSDSTSPTPQTATAVFTLTATSPFHITTETIPAGAVGVSYSVTLAATGGTVPYIWTLTSGSLPPGLNLSYTGILSGTPTTAGTYTFAVHASDSASPILSDSTTYTVAIQPPLVISTPTIPDGQVGTVYTHTFSATGGMQPYTWSVAAGTLPPGLTLAPDGTISGIPTTNGAYSFTVKVTDSAAAQTATRTYALNITIELAIATAQLPDGYTSTDYVYPLAATGGTTPYTWFADPSSLPPGLSLSTSGVLAGTPTATGLYTLVVTVRDNNIPAHTASRTLALLVHRGLTISTTALPDGQVATPYTAILAATDGTPPYAWSVVAGSLPPGLTLSAAGTISGVPSAAGGSHFTISVQDTSQPALHATRAYTLTVTAGFTITTTSLPAGTPGTSYTATLHATGGSTPYAWTIVSGTLPPGLSLSTDGTISGIPTANGAYSFTVQAADAAGLTASRLFSIAIGPALTISTTTLADAKLGVFYRQSLTALNGLQPYYWTLQNGALPPGLILLPSGDIIGQPTAIGPSTFTVTVSDAAQPPVSASQTFTLTVTPGFAITTSALPNGSPGVPYHATLQATDGTEPYTWSVALGQLPRGLALNAATGELTGTPSTPGLSNLLIQATDSATPPQATTRQFTLNVDTSLQITTATLPDASTGQAYYQPLTAVNGILPLSWSLGSALPPGITLLPSGELYGVPTVPGQYEITFAVADSSQPPAHASRNLMLLVTRALTITTTTLPTALTVRPYATVILAAGGTPPYTWAIVSGSLPPGLSLSPIGTITGTPTAAGTYTLALKATDAAGDTASRSLVIVVGQLLTITTTTLPHGTTGQTYVALVTAAGGTLPYAWSITSGTLPAGITFIPSIAAFIGTPAQSGQYPIQLAFTDQQQNASAALTITIGDPLSITTTQLPPLQQSLAYSATLQATGGVPPYTWSLASNNLLPAGLSLSRLGILAGITAAAPTTVSLPFCVTDSAQPAGKICATRSLVIGPAFHITTSSLPRATKDQPISIELKADGALGPITWTTAFPLPTGLSLSSDGTLSGTPTTTGDYTITVIATDTSHQLAVADFLFTVLPPLTIQTVVLPAAIVGVPYAAGLVVTSGQPPYSWSVDPASLPPGFTVDASGILYGNPAEPNDFTVAVTVTDAASPSQTTSASLFLTIDAPLTIATASLPSARVGSPYETSLSASGVPPLQWTLTSGQLPDGITLAEDGTLSGTPIKDGLYAVVFRVTDAHGQTAVAPFPLNVGPALGMPSSESALLPDGKAGEPYTYHLHSTSSEARWALVIGLLPAGLSLSTDGTISGTPTAAGSSSFLLQAYDDDQTATQTYTLLIQPSGIPNTPTPTIPSASTQLPSADIDHPYLASLTATGGTPPYMWALAEGHLPGGLVLAGATISGTATTAGTYSFALTVTDSNNQTSTALYSMLVRSALTITSPNTIVGHVGTALRFRLSASGGTPPYMWALADSSTPLPPGLALNAAGTISGTPNAPADTTIIIALHDSSPQPAIAQAVITLKVASGLAVITTTLPQPTHNVSYTASLSAAGGTAPYAWSISDGALPQGLTLTPEGTIAGIPSANGAYHFSITVTDASRQTATATYAITVLDPLTITTHGALTVAIGQPANIPLSATGGIQPYTWSISSGALPQGLTFSPIGMISGTPTQSTSSSITLSVRDSAQPVSTASASIVLTTASVLAVSTRTLPPANQRIPYQAALQASGGTPPYTWSISSGALAPGLSLAPDGLITGTPSTVGTYPFGVTLQDATGQQTDATITCTVTPLTVITTTLPQGTAGAPYIAAVEARGGLPPYSWTAAGSLPKGLSFTADGIITGTAAATGTFELTITAADQANATASASLVLTIITPFGGHLQFGAIASPSLATQLPISLTLDTPAPIDLTGSIDIQFQADQASREDSSVLFISTASLSVSFTVPKGSNSAHFAQPVLLNTGTTAGSITLTGQLSASPGSTTTTAIRLAPTPPVITGAQILSRDAYTVTIEVTGYSPTTEVTTAQFAFTGLPTQRDLTIPVQDLFAAWYHSGGAADGTFRYTQRFNFTGDSRDLSRLIIALTNTVGQSQSYTLTF